MNLLNLFATLKLDKSDYDKGISEAKKEGVDLADTTEKKISPQMVAGWVAVATAVISVVKAIGDLAKQSMDYADQIGELANKFGVTTDSIAEMQYIGTQTGASIESITSAMSMLLNRAKENGEAFQRLGVSVTDANGNFKAMDELFYETIGALNNIESEGERSAMMLETFGRSAMTVGELLRKDTAEIEAMRKEAHDLGIVLNEETTEFAGSFFDNIDALKLQGQSALASLVAGAPDAEEKLQNFFDGVIEMLDDYVPAFVNFGVKLILQVTLALVRLAPSLAVEIVNAITDTLLNIDLFQVGVDLAKSVLEGFINMFVSTINRTLKYFGVNIPKVDLGVGESIYTPDMGSEYEINENIKSDITVKVEASGDTTVSQATAEETAKALAPYIDKILGGK